MQNNVLLTNYANNTPDGVHWGHLIDIYYGVPYPLGKRDLIIFLMTTYNGMEPILDSGHSPQFAVAVCNHTQGKSSKSKINLIARCLCRKENNLSLIESFSKVPSIDTFRWDKEKYNEPYKLIVKNKTLNGNTVSNITHIESYLYGKLQSIEQKFNTKLN